MSIKNGLLTIPEDGELFRIAGFYPKSLPGTSRLNSAAPRISRRVLHEWPLSRVEAAEFPDDPDVPQRIVKIQLSEASVERDFFRFAAPLLRNGRNGIRIPELLGWELAGDCDWMILSREEGTPENWSSLTKDEIRERVRQINAVFQSPDFSRAPVFTDWSTAARFAGDIQKDIPALLSGGMENPGQISDWLDREGRKCWNSPVGLLHGDLKAENLLAAGDGTVLLDWQRPLRAPLPLEESLSILLERGIHEAPGPGENAVFDSLACFYLAHWYAWAWRACLPYPFVLKQAVTYASAGLSFAE